MSRTVTIEPNGQEIPLKYRESGRGFRFDVNFEAGDGEEYTYHGWLSPYLPDDVSTPYTRRELTGDVIETALEGFADEVDVEVVRYTRVSVERVTEVRAYHES